MRALQVREATWKRGEGLGTGNVKEDLVSIEKESDREKECHEQRGS